MPDYEVGWFFPTAGLVLLALIALLYLIPAEFGAPDDGIES